MCDTEVSRRPSVVCVIKRRRIVVIAGKKKDFRVCSRDDSGLIAAVQISALRPDTNPIDAGIVLRSGIVRDGGRCCIIGDIKLFWAALPLRRTPWFPAPTDNWIRPPCAQVSNPIDDTLVGFTVARQILPYI